MDKLNCYVDGSFNETTKQASWAFIIIKNEEVIHTKRGIILDENWNSGRQISGECFAVVNALEWAKENNIKLSIRYDYTGLFNWVADLFNQKPWKTNKEYTILYRKKVLAMRENIVDFVKIKSHSGDRFNELADQLAKIN